MDPEILEDSRPDVLNGILAGHKPVFDKSINQIIVNIEKGPTKFQNKMVVSLF